MKHFESMKYMEESLNTRQDNYMKHSSCIQFIPCLDNCHFFCPFFFGGATPLRKRVGGVPPVFSRGIGRFDFKGFFLVGRCRRFRRNAGDVAGVCFFSPGVIFFPSPPEKNTPPTLFSTLFTMKKKINIFSCLISFVLAGSLHTFVFFPDVWVNLHFSPKNSSFERGKTLNLDRLL